MLVIEYQIEVKAHTDNEWARYWTTSVDSYDSVKDEANHAVNKSLFAEARVLARPITEWSEVLHIKGE